MSVCWYVLCLFQPSSASGHTIAYCEQIRIWCQTNRTPLAAVADFYFLMGIFALILCTAVAFRPSIFRAKGNPVVPPYPVWTNDKDPRLRYGASVVSLIPVLSLLSFAEHHLVAKYKYIQIMIGGKIYFVAPEDWVPEHSNVLREKVSGSLLGVPKVPDGFNIW